MGPEGRSLKARVWESQQPEAGGACRLLAGKDLEKPNGTVFDRSRVGSGNSGRGRMGPGGEEGRALDVQKGLDQRKWPRNTRVAAWDTLGQAWGWRRV